MDATDWEPLKRLFEQARELPAEEQRAFLEDACADDPAKEAQLASLLAAAEEADPFFDSLADEVLSLSDWSEAPEGAEEADPFIGRTIHQYQIEAKLGRGGMGTVYLAEDLKHRRQVAIKILRPDVAATLGAKRFLQEIQIAAHLIHPHILPLHDSGEADGLLYFVMPHIEGESLRRKLDREKQLPVDEAVRIATEVADALEYAHGHGVIHRDIKPANILLHEGRALVADFGIALAMSAAGGERLTETGLSVGTPHYMSPEQATGDREPDGRSDLYSLASVLHEMLAGEPPHTGPTAQSVLAKILGDEPEPLGTVRRSVPANVDSAVRKALEKLPGDRFSTVGEFTTALRDDRFRHGTDLATLGAEHRVSLLTIGLAIAVLVLSVLLWRSWSDEPLPASSSRYALNLGGNNPSPVGLGVTVALSPDGTQLAYRGPVSGGSHLGLWIKRADDLRPRVMAQVEIIQPFFSPDGDRIAWTGARARGQHNGLSYMSLGTGIITQVADSGVWHAGGDWSEDGWLYVESDEGRIVRLSESTFERQNVTTLKDGEVEHVLPQVLPGGAVLFTIWYEALPTNVRPDGTSSTPAQGPGPTDIAVFDPDERTHRVIAPGFMARYSETGHLLVVTRDGTLAAAPFDRGRYELEGPLTPVMSGIGTGPGGANLAISRAGQMVFTTALRTDPAARELTWVDRAGVARPFAEGWRAPFESVAIAPDSGLLAVTVGEATETTIWVKRLDESPPVRLTFKSGLNRRPTWPPGAGTVGFISDRDGLRALYTKRADGLGSADLAFETPLDVDQAHWSRDGEWIVYRTGKFTGGERDIFARRTRRDTTIIRIAANQTTDEHSPAISPDGRFVAYVSDEGGGADVWVRPFPDVESGRWQVSDGGGREPVWAHDGSELFFRTNEYLVSAAVRLDPTFRITSVDTLFSTQGYFFQRVHASYDVAPDDRQFLMIREPTIAPELILVTNIDRLLDRTGN